MKQTTVGKLVSIALLLTIVFSAVWVVLAFINFYKYRNTNIPVAAAYKIQSALSIIANIEFFIILLCIIELVSLSSSKLGKNTGVALLLLILVLVIAFVCQVLVFLTIFQEVLYAVIDGTTTTTYNYNAEQLFGTSVYGLLALTVINIILGVVIITFAYSSPKSEVAQLSGATVSEEQSVETVRVQAPTVSSPAAASAQLASPVPSLTSPYGAPSYESYAAGLYNNPALNAAKYPKAFAGSAFGRYTTTP